MTLEAQRIAIAEACGWKNVRQTGENSGLCQWVGEPPFETGWNEWSKLPNYLSDLNAMHEAEKVLVEQDQIEDYWKELWLVVKPTEAVLINVAAIKYLIRATATQRAEAFLRTLNLWNDMK